MTTGERQSPGSRFAGFVLVGGRSSRMGTDKALLPYTDTVLAAHIARVVDRAVGSATLIGSPERYGGLGHPVIPDLRPGMGPLAGIETALSVSEAEWNLVVACDMPRLSLDFLGRLLARTSGSTCRAVVPVSAHGPEPLCAVWRTDCLAEASRSLDEGRRKLQMFMESLEIDFWHPEDGQWNLNLNTPQDWRRHRDELHPVTPEI